MKAYSFLRAETKGFSYRLASAFAFAVVVFFTIGFAATPPSYATEGEESEEISESESSELPPEYTEEATPEEEPYTPLEPEEGESSPETQGFQATSEPASTVNEFITPGGDDSSYRIPLEVPILFDGVYYTDVYATTNSVITFGQPDGTFWDFPATPSVSLQSRDWWARPHMGDEWFIIRTSQGGFQVDGSYRPFGTNSGPTTNIVITAQILTNGTVSYTYSVVGPLYGGERTGARLNNGSVVTLEQVGVQEVATPVVLEPEPAPPAPEPEPEPPVVEPEPEPEPEPTPEPEIEPEPVPVPLLPSPLASSVEPERAPLLLPALVQPTPQPAPAEPAPTPQETSPEPTSEDLLEQVLNNPNSSVEEKVDAIIATLEPGEPVTLDILLKAGLTFADLPPETPVEIRTDEDGNPVVITAEVAAQLAVFSDINSLVEAAFKDLGALIGSLQHVGKDMTEEERKESQAVVVSAVIVANIASLASSSAAAGAVIAYRRNP
jgi:hypothetical protein